MLSILIPVYNYDVTTLVEELHRQASNCCLKFEVRIYDDASKPNNYSNHAVNEFENVLFKPLPKNIGRSCIRNLLAKDAIYENLLFIDAGTFPKNKDFIKKYISVKNQKVINGGMTYLNKKPKKPYKLRWIYTKKRESTALCSSNFLIKKNIIKRIPFDESIKKYGYEDVIFFNNLTKNNISILTIKNQVYHLIDDDANTFIKKTEYAIKNLLELSENNKIGRNQTNLLRYTFILEGIKLINFTASLFKLLKPMLLKNFNSSFPLLLLFDFYRLGYFCLLKRKK